MDGKTRVLIFTGNGKGKTTAALGMALRASGHGLRTLILQFLKSDPNIGEMAALKNLPGVELVQMGRGFVPSPASPAFSEHREAAFQAVKMAGEALRSKRYDLVVLDEICMAVAKGLITEDDVMQLIDQSDEGSCLVLTGRGATDRLISRADTVTEMCCVKHGFEEGWPAQKGVEY